MELQDIKKMVNKEEVVVDEEEGSLPGFRFHPTDEELVCFYLKRKVQKRPISIEIIKQIDIYKHDPWELATEASSVGDKEWYFYCRRGRKYRNSSRPNRVITGSGFWKATGIDRPVYSNSGEGHQCVGLKKSLVYYRGCGGKGTKTDWMMHEFRLPSDHQCSGATNPNDTLQEVEVWTLCRIFKRNQKNTTDWREISAKRAAITNNNNTPCYIPFVNPTPPREQHESYMTNNYSSSCTGIGGLLEVSAPQLMAQSTPSDGSNFSSPFNPSSSVDDQGSLFHGGYGGNWDDLSSVIEFATSSPHYEERV